jgi:hypothetical protein
MSAWGGLKQLELEENGRRDVAWQFAADKKNFRCKVCGEIPPREEREIYFDTKMCGYHAHQAQKDD